jgi:NAD(P)-dependent dehydrogenase (short-subunit alcohol dehydrogenase family)
MELANTTVLITGGASGLGAATAALLASSGAKLCLLDRNLEAAQRTAESLKAHAIACDVTDENSVQQAIETATKLAGTPRVVINCAGILGAGRILTREGSMAGSFFEQVLKVNLLGSFNVLRLSALAMQALDPVGSDKERGVIINTASIAAYEGQIGQAAYAASKGGIVSLTLPAAREFARLGIRVNAIAPGPVDTPMVAGMPDDVRASLEATVPFPPRLVKPEEYAKLARHIIENVAINGEVIRLDGALRMAPK